MRMGIKLRPYFGVFFLCFYLGTAAAFSASDNKNNTVSSNAGDLLGKSPRARQVIARASLVWEGDRLVEKELYDQAILKYQEAVTDKYIKQSKDKNAALNGLVNANQMLGLYEEAYKLNEEKIKTGSGRKEWRLRSQELLALIEFKRENNSVPVMGFITKRNEIMKKSFNAKKIAFDEKSQFEKSLYLYEIIGDYDAALKLCDEYLAMKKVKKDKKFKAEVEDLRKTILEAKVTREKNKIFKKLNEYDFYNWL